MIPLSLRVTNFRSVRETQVFHFAQEPGLYFMRGINEVEDRLEANGAGKSTLWDALTWCWWNKTSKGLKAGDVCNWEVEKGTVVEFDFMLPGDEQCVWTMRRTWGPISWTLSHIAEYITDEEVVDLTKEKDNPALSWLALDFDQWLTCVLMAQGQPMFLDLKREAQASLFSSVVGADLWLDFSARSSKRAADEDRRVRDMERELSRLQGELDAVGKQDFRRSAEEYESNRTSLLAEMGERHDKLVARRKAAKNELEQAQTRESEARKALAALTPDNALELAYEAAKAEEELVEANLSRKRIQYDEIHKRVGKLEGGNSCPVCGQRLDREHRRRELSTVEGELRTLRETIEVCARRLRAIGIERENAASQLRVLDAKRGAIVDDVDDAQRAAANARREIDALDRDLDRLEDEHDRLREERNPHAEMEERVRERAHQLRQDLDSMQQKLDDAVARQSLFQFWVRGFKDVRLMKMDEALTELEVEANSGVDALGLLGWELQFAVDRETKGGKIERGFNCLVRSPANDRQVPWEAWSGGEGQRLRLAATMGLSDLIRSRTGASIPLEVWDEPTAGLSPQGVRDLLECLAERAVREQRVIYLVDHKSHDFGGFAGGCTVRKTAKGTIVETGIDKV